MLTPLRGHILAVVFAFVTGAVIVGPQIAFIVNEGEHYQGVYMLAISDEAHYLASMKQLYDDGKIGNPYLYEYKYYGPQFWSSGGETLLAAPGKWLGISVPTINLVYKFLLPALEFLLVYALVFRLSRSRSWSMAGALMVFMGLAYLDGENFRHLIYADEYFRTHFLFAGRPVQPQLSQLLFFLYLHGLLNIHEGKSYRWFFLLAIILAFSFYSYFFSFTFILALNAVFVVMWYLSGKRRSAWGLGLATLAAIVAGIPPLWEIYAAIHFPDYAQVAENGVGVGLQHRPILHRPWLFVTALFGIYVYATKAWRVVNLRRTHILFIFGLLATAIAVLNQQVLSGVVIQYYHYIWYFNQPVFAVVLAFLGAALFAALSARNPRLQKLFRFVPWVVALVFIATGILTQYSAYRHYAPIVHEDQRYGIAFQWLMENTPKDSVVMANQYLSELIPIYTENNVVWNSVHILTSYFVPPERVKFTPENLLAAPDFLAASRAYRLDYVLWDTKKDPDWKIDRLSLPLLYSGDGFDIYGVPK